MMKTITVLLHVCSIIQSKSSKLIANPLFDLVSQRTLLYLVPSSYCTSRYHQVATGTCQPGTVPNGCTWYLVPAGTLFFLSIARTVLYHQAIIYRRYCSLAIASKINYRYFQLTIQYSAEAATRESQLKISITGILSAKCWPATKRYFRQIFFSSKHSVGTSHYHLLNVVSFHERLQLPPPSIHPSIHPSIQLIESGLLPAHSEIKTEKLIEPELMVLSPNSQTYSAKSQGIPGPGELTPPSTFVDDFPFLFSLV